jgi:hypothetical protein
MIECPICERRLHEGLSYNFCFECEFYEEKEIRNHE